MKPSSSSREQDLAGAFVSLADTLVDDYDVIDLLTRLVEHSVGLLHADAGGILLADPHGLLRVVAASNEDAALIELMQLQNDEGPCLEAYRTATPVITPDLSVATHRWPKFVAAALEQSVFRAVHAVPLRLRGDAIGALNLWSHRPGPIHADDLALGQALADIATIAILQERAIRRAEVLNEQLQSALTSRVIIEQAKGALAQYASVSMEQAFELLRRYARTHRRRLSEVATDLIEHALHPHQILAATPDAR
jgi:GAF domain-containing protein